MGSQGDEETGEGSPEVPLKRSIFRYYSPLVQIGLIGLVCFCCPGMFNDLSGMGGGGQVGPPPQTTLTPPSTPPLRCLVFTIVAGAFLGIGAGHLWASQGAIMTSYPPHDRKGTDISLFWSIFNMGCVIGGLIPFVLNFHRTEAVSVNDGTYIGFMVFMSIGNLELFCNWLILHSSCRTMMMDP